MTIIMVWYYNYHKHVIFYAKISNHNVLLKAVQINYKIRFEFRNIWEHTRFCLESFFAFDDL